MMKEVDMQDTTYALAASPDFGRDGVCFAGRSSGLYRSDDGGRTWHFSYAALNPSATLNPDAPLTTMAVAVSPDFARDRHLFAGVAGGVLRAFDSGEHWQAAVFPSPPPLVLALAISPNYTRDGTLLAGTLEDGVFRSADRGSTWAAWNFGLLDLNILCVALSPDFAADETLFVGTETGVFCSTNGGRAWREVPFPAELAPVLCLTLSPDYARDGVLFAGTEAAGLYRSSDRGRTWVRLGAAALPEAVNAIVLSPYFPTHPELLALTGDALLVSRDGGASWADWQDGLNLDAGAACLVAPLGLAPDAPLLVGLGEGGVLRI